MTTEGGLRQCLTDLTRADTSGDYQKALLAANRLIRRYPKEHYAFKCKLVCLIHLSMYDDALTLLRKTPPSQMGECAFEKAYILYRLERNDDALEALKACDKTDQRAQELRAQLYYRLDRFQEALEIFRDLFRNHSDDYDDERKANYLAVVAQLEAMGMKQVGFTLRHQLYNSACQLIEAGNYELALKNLDKSIALCRETLSEEGLDEEEVEDELAVLCVQRAYVLHKLGRKNEAIELYRTLQAAGPSDIGVIVTLANNLASAMKDQNIADARRKLKNALQLDQKKLSTRQRRILMLNNALVLLHSNQREPCRRALDDLIKAFGATRDTRLIEAALCFRLNEFEKAIKVRFKCRSIAASVYCCITSKYEVEVFLHCIPQYSCVCSCNETSIVKVFPVTVDESINVDNLEESDWILYGEKYKQKKEAKSEEIVTRKLKNRKRKRKIRLPKNYDPNVPPDPERWLPKQERAAYKKRQKKNRDRDIGRGTQGSVSTNPNVEYVSASPSSPRPMAVTMPEGPRQMRPKQQPKKKKKPSKF
ncbi:unnamed protein product [Angiostrongylus costaricensis]|uniref:Signal recognition particle subunit SRP72 n=1 Tax=Angiostrongylus costaricensis TaxID=334426 RepID=A0A0R3PLU9_ANGCS|nr:unnamed protein product [Angiostrongylus costaricensis]